MGQKIHPNGFRVGITRDWNSRWFSKKNGFGDLLIEDDRIRKFVKEEYYFAGIPKVEIERKGDQLMILVHCARPGVLIGRKGVKVDKLKEQLEKLTGKAISLNIHEITRPEQNAQLVAEGIAEQLEKRASFRRTMKRAIQLTMDRGALGIRIRMAGRLGGAEIARVEAAAKGSIPLTTLAADIDYGFAEARCSYGRIGVKVWIYKGLIRRDAPLQRSR
ncbi:MAG: 30S ribosomal protein S3 [Planctomycetes bacterium]|nr:30S ribosomal protein S3 [Planctomycetota bacterium]